MLGSPVVFHAFFLLPKTRFLQRSFRLARGRSSATSAISLPTTSPSIWPVLLQPPGFPHKPQRHRCEAIPRRSLLLAAAAMIFRPGTAVWVEHPDLAWAEAEVVSSPTSPSSPSSVTVVLSTGVKVRAQRPRQPVVSIPSPTACAAA